MKSPLPVFPRLRQDRGVALVLVLSMVVLISVLIVGFLSSISTELQSSKSYASGASARLLADSAVNIVITQIQEATRHPQLAWASQPGMIRTYDAVGNPDSAYKLYSSDSMKVTGAFDPLQAVAVEAPQGWNTASNLGTFVDLNEPVKLGPDSHNPILHSDTLDGTIEGLHSTRGVEMPVRWLYVLKDGAMAAMNNSQVAGATAANPVVGRIAFWADDETSKINVNTASEGHFWGRPWAEGVVERKMSVTIPAQDEFQAYPGHPATTSLSAVLKLGSASAKTSDYYDITPRVEFGGTQGGEVSPTAGAPLLPVPLDADRLYASIDELNFKPEPNGGERAANHPMIDAATLEKMQFVLTTSSRAPEVNLFNKPRVTLWPLQKDVTARNAKDKLIAFASELQSPTGTGKLPYYILRESHWTPPHNKATFNSDALSSQSPDADWGMTRNQQIYAYLQSLTATGVPGFGGSFASKLGLDRDQLLTQMVDYMRSQINTMSPSTGLPPVYSFTPPRTIRGDSNFPQVPISGEGQVVPLKIGSTQGFGRFSTVTEAAVVFYRSNEKPSEGVDPGTQRMRGVLILENFNPTPGIPSWSPRMTFRIKNLDGLKVNGATVFPDDNRALNQVTGIAGWQGGGGHGSAFNGLTGNFTHSVNVNTNASAKNRDLGFKTLSTSGTDFEKTYVLCTDEIAVAPGSTFQFSGATITVEIYAGKEDQPNSADPVQTLDFDFPSASAPVPELSDQVPAVEATDPPVLTWNFDHRIRYYQHHLGFGSPLVLNGDVVFSVGAREDQPVFGDFRLIAGRPQVPASYFKPHPGYGSIVGTLPGGSHSLRGPRSGKHGTGQPGSNSDGLIYNNLLTGGSPAGSLIAGVTYDQKRQPSTAPGLAAARTLDNLPGDWDTGLGNSPDGPYINKSDESNQELQIGTSSTQSSFYSLQQFSAESGQTYSPNRQVASAVAFGSLPVGVKRQRPWETLLFSPHPAAGSAHPGFGEGSGTGSAAKPPFIQPPDHLLLDLFTMPIVEPYAISEPFSTAGKINMNYQITPFTYIHRSTGIRGVMKSVKMMAIRSGDAATYKFKANGSQQYRYEIEMGASDPTGNAGTLKGFEDRFNSGDIFRSASEICTISLVPKDVPGGSPTYDGMPTWWEGYKLTGDNVREEPYGYIYPRLTTKSNTFTVHVRAQTLQKVPGTSRTTFVDPEAQGKTDQVTSEFRGSFTVQRYLDANADSFVKPSGDEWVSSDELDSQAMVGPYKVRVLNVKQFAP